MFVLGVLGLVNCVEGEVKLEGSVGYVPQVSSTPIAALSRILHMSTARSQSASIINDTVEGNILFGSKMDRTRYLEVLHACCLDQVRTCWILLLDFIFWFCLYVQDMSQFPDGDQTEIGAWPLLSPAFTCVGCR